MAEPRVTVEVTLMKENRLTVMAPWHEWVADVPDRV